MLLVQIGPVSLAAMSTTDYPITNVQLTGPFWVVAVFDQATNTPVEAGSAGDIWVIRCQAYGPLPSTFGASTPSTSAVYRLFAMVAP